MQILSLFGPVLFVPVVVAGFLIDLLLFQTLGLFSIIGIAIGLVLVFAGLIATLLSLPVEKEANEIAMKMIKDTGVLTKEETEIVKKIFKAYIVSYVCEFIVAVLRIIQIILEIVMNVQINNKNN